MKRLALRGGVGVVTGAASGIGRAVARELARAGCALALADRNAEGVEVTAREARRLGVHATAHALDVADEAAVAAAARTLLADHGGRATLLVNNAGVGLVGRADEVSMAELRTVLEVNFFGAVGLTRALLPALRAEPAAQIVTVSSLYGLVGPARETAYEASKFAVRGYFEALRHELRGTTVGVTLVHPGGVRTRIAADAAVAAAADAGEAAYLAERFTRLALRRSPEAAARTIVRAAVGRAPRVLVGPDAVAVDWLQRLAPARYWAAMQWPYRHLTRRP